MTARVSGRPPGALRRAALKTISARLGQPAADAVVALADASYPDVARRIPATGRGARHLLRISAYAIVLHTALVDCEVESELATALTSDAVCAAIRPSRNALVLVGRLRHRDRLRRALWASSVARRFYYRAPDWLMVNVPIEGGFGIDVTRCVVAEFFESFGMSEFCQRVICDQDARDAAYRDIVFERSGTLAGGADRCDFRYHLRPAGAAPHERSA